MIGGFFFLASIIAIFIVLNWFVRNDKLAENETTTGLLAMRSPSEGPASKEKRQWTREDALRR